MRRLHFLAVLVLSLGLVLPSGLDWGDRGASQWGPAGHTNHVPYTITVNTGD